MSRGWFVTWCVILGVANFRSVFTWLDADLSIERTGFSHWFYTSAIPPAISLALGMCCCIVASLYYHDHCKKAYND